MRSARLGLLPMVLLLLILPWFENISGNSENGIEPPAVNVVEQSVAYVQNVGQFPENVLYQAHVGDVTLYFHRHGVTHVVTRDAPTAAQSQPNPELATVDLLDPNFGSRPAKEVIVTTSAFVGANPDVEIDASGRQQYTSNYFLGNDQSKWRVGVPSFSEVIYRDIYPDIDLKYYSDRGAVKYDYVVRPGGDISRIETRYDGFDELRVTPEGKMQIRNEVGQIEEGLPVIYQEIDGRRIPVSGKYKVKSSRSFGFEVDNEYDATKPLTIDPLLFYSNYLGGAEEDWGYGLAIGKSVVPYVFVVGHTWSPDFPSGLFYDPHQGDAGSFDVFLTVYDPTANVRISSTYLGGEGDDWGFGIDVDSAASTFPYIGDVYLTGATSSSDFPLQNAYDNSLGGKFDAFVTRLRHAPGFPKGTVSLVYSTYLGGDGYDVGNDLVVDNSSQDAYIAGMTYSANFPQSSGSDYGGYWDGFVAKVASGGTVTKSRYLGGGSVDAAYGIDLRNDLYLTGWTWSADFPTSPPDTLSGPQDAFVVRLSTTLAAPTYARYLGGTGRDYGKDIAVYSGAACMTGWTESDDFPTLNPAYASRNGPVDAFVTKVSTADTTILYSTFLGGTGVDCGYGIAADGDGRVYVTGKTESTDFPITAEPPAIADQAATDAFFTRFSATNTIDFSTYFGGAGEDWGYGIALWSPPLFNHLANLVYITGKTNSDTLPPADYPWQENSGSYDVFVAWYVSENFGWSIELPIASIDVMTPNPASEGVEVTFQGSGSHSANDTLDHYIAYRWWSDIDGFLSDQEFFTRDDLSVGTHQIHFSVQDTLFMWSQDDVGDLVILDPQNRPTAIIDSILPNPAVVGEDVYFWGSGTDSMGGTIQSHEWTIDGSTVLSTLEDFNTNAILPGTHTIEFRVWDDEDNESHADGGEVTVMAAPAEYWEISWWQPEYSDEFSLQMHDHYACTLIVHNPMQHQQILDFGIARDIKFLEWDDDEADTLSLVDTFWRIEWVDSPEIDGQPYQWDSTLVDTFVPGETKRYVFSTYNDWTWIGPPSLLSLVSMVLSFTPAHWAFGTGLELITYAQSYYAYETAPTKVELRDSLIGDAWNPDFPADGLNVSIVYVREEKVTFYWRSLLLAFIGARFSNAGWVALAVIPAPWSVPIAVACFAVEAILYGASLWVYWAAWDPDPNFMEFVHAPPIQDISAYTHVNSMDESCWKDMAYGAIEAYSLDSASYVAYAKCAGALQANSTEWTARQMAASYAYSVRAITELDEVGDFGAGILLNLGPPDADAVEDIKNEIETDSLPQIEDDILGGFAIDADTTGIATDFLNRYNASNWEEFAGAYVGLTDTLQSAVSSAMQTMDHLFAKGVNGAVLGNVVKVEPEVVPGGPQNRFVTVWLDFPGLMLPLASNYTFSSMSASSDAAVAAQPITLVGYEDGNGDNDLDLKLTFNADLWASGYQLQSIYGTVIDIGPDTLAWDTIPFAAAAIFEVISSNADTVLAGCITEPETFRPIENLVVELCADPVCVFHTDVTLTDGGGGFAFSEVPSGDWYLRVWNAGPVRPSIIGGPDTITSYGCEPVSYTFRSFSPSDSVHGPVEVAANDTARVCLAIQNDSQEPTWFVLASGPGSIDSASGVWTHQPTDGTGGSAVPFSVYACNQYGCGETVVGFLAVDAAPQFVAGCDVVDSVSIGEVSQIEMDAMSCYPILYDVASVTPTPIGNYSIDTSGGFEFSPAPGDRAKTFTFTIEATIFSESSYCDVYVVISESGGCCGIYTGGRTGNADGDKGGIVDLGDLLYMANAVFLGGTPLACMAAGNTDGDPTCTVDLGDILWLASAIFLGGAPNAECMPECE